MPSLTEIRLRIDEISAICAKHGAGKVRVFGSVARGGECPLSDVDFLVAFEKDRSLFDRIELEYSLTELLGVPVDVVNERALHWFIRDDVLAEAMPL